jgi:hypothetical protein
MDLIERLHNWTSQKIGERLLRKWGQTRECPWCRQIIEQGGNHKIRQSEHCPFFDTFTCGICGGESHWEFGPAPLARGLGKPPEPAEWAINADRETRDLLAALQKDNKT